jgi:1-phosphofructokinase family hexose kinase
MAGGMAILCITPNPAIDRVLAVDGFTAGGVWRAHRVEERAGGKGVNVARVLGDLGLPALCCGLLAGDAGARLAALAAGEGLDARWTWAAPPVEGETRVTTVIIDDAGRTTVINAPGPMLAAADWARFIDDAAAAADAWQVCISGSLPPGAPLAGLVQLAAAVRGDGRPVWLDSSGDALAAAMASGAASIKINAEEAGALLGRSAAPVSPSEALAAARQIQARGCPSVVITLGAAGAVLASAAGAWLATPPPVAAVNPVGSGDAFFAGLLAALQAGAGEAEALRRATACGAANALTFAPGVINPSDVECLAAATTVTRLAG